MDPIIIVLAKKSQIVKKFFSRSILLELENRF